MIFSKSSMVEVAFKCGRQFFKVHNIFGPPTYGTGRRRDFKLGSRHLKVHTRAPHSQVFEQQHPTRSRLESTNPITYATWTHYSDIASGAVLYKLAVTIRFKQAKCQASLISKPGRLRLFPTAAQVRNKTSHPMDAHSHGLRNSQS